MKSITTFLLISLSALLLKPPLYSQSVLTAAGDQHETETVQVQWTLGEIAVQSQNVIDLHIKEGFLQSTIEVEDIMTATRNRETEFFLQMVWTKRGMVQ